jgi:type I restriction enzyme R subunit
VIVITDEAHRSQYDIFALNMRNALPNAGFIGFTGTPLIKGEEERTREVFGDYVSVYDFARSIEDGATVPLYYENRIPEVQLTNEDLNRDLEDAARSGRAGRGAGEEAGARVRPRVPHHHPRRPAGGHRQGHGGALHRPRLPRQGDDGVHRQGHRGAHVRQGAGALEGRDRAAEGGAGTGEGRRPREALIARIHLMETTDMAVVVSQGQNEIEDLKAKGLDIVPHRQRMLKESLDEKFKDPRRTTCGWCSSARCGSPASTCRPARRSTWTSRCGRTR